MKSMSNAQYSAIKRILATCRSENRRLAIGANSQPTTNCKTNFEEVMKPKIHIASCSFGKDSIATILLALENNEPLDRVVFSEVMFDISRGISGEIPEHIEWIYSTAIPKPEQVTKKC